MKRAFTLGTIGFLGLVAFAIPVRESFATAIALMIIVAGVLETAQNLR